MIKDYKFGSITINGDTYDYDIELRWTGEVLKWWREESHTVEIKDIERALKQKPDTIVIGKGAMGMVKISQECQDFIKKQGIELVIDKTEEAVKTFNIILEESGEEEGKQEKVIGLFHLTC
jgi:hypothetical protein